MGSGAKPQPTNDSVHIRVKSAAVCVDFLRTDVTFSSKASLISYGGSNSQGGALSGVFVVGQTGSRHDCRTEVAAPVNCDRHVPGSVHGSACLPLPSLRPRRRPVRFSVCRCRGNQDAAVITDVAAEAAVCAARGRRAAAMPRHRRSRCPPARDGVRRLPVCRGRPALPLRRPARRRRLHGYVIAPNACSRLPTPPGKSGNLAENEFHTGKSWNLKLKVPKSPGIFL